MKVQKTPSMKCVARFVLFGKMRLLNTIFLFISEKDKCLQWSVVGRMRGKNSHSFDLPPTTLLLLAFPSSFALTKTSVPLWYLLFFIIIIITSIHSSYLCLFFCVCFSRREREKNKRICVLYMSGCTILLFKICVCCCLSFSVCSFEIYNLTRI